MQAETIVFDLTPLTRGVKHQRRTTIAGRDIAQRTLVTFGIGAIATAVMSLALWPLIGQYGIIFGALLSWAAVLYVRTASAKGMGISPFRSRYDKVVSGVGTFTIMGDPIDMDRIGVVTTFYRVALPLPEPTIDGVYQ